MPGEAAAQVADVALQAMAEGRTRHAPDQAAGGEEGVEDDPEGEEWTAEQLSDAALLASSVLSSQGPTQVFKGNSSTTHPVPLMWCCLLRKGVHK